MGRTAGSKNKPKVAAPIVFTTMDKVKLQLPKDPERYTAKSVYQLILNMRKKLERDPTAIDPLKYILLLEKYEAIVKNLKKKETGNVRPRMDSRNVAKGVPESGETSRDGDAFPFGVGS